MLNKTKCARTAVGRNVGGLVAQSVSRSVRQVGNRSVDESVTSVSQLLQSISYVSQSVKLNIANFHKTSID